MLSPLVRGRLRHAIPVGVFTAAYLLAATAFAFSRGNWEFIFYIAVVLLLAGLATLVHVRVGLSRGVLLALSVWGLLHMLGGLLVLPDTWPISGDKHVLYSLWLIPDFLKYDHVVHAYGFATATFVCWQSLHALLRLAVPSTGAIALCALAALGLGAINEIVEFVAVLLIPDTNVGGYMNTGWDLVANTVGATSAAAWIWVSGFYTHPSGGRSAES